MKIPNRYTNETIFEAEADSMKELVELAVKQGANLYGANLTGASLEGANLTRANLYGANLTGASLEGANLTRVNLTGASLYGASLEGASLTGANLTGANLTRANLTRANLYGASLEGANLEGANLTGANLDFSCWPLWCGSLGVKVDDRIWSQIFFHLTRMNTEACSENIRFLHEKLRVLPEANSFCEFRTDVDPI